MKKCMKNRFFLFLLTLLATGIANSLAAQEDSVVSKEITRLKYFNDNNSVQFLVLENSLKNREKNRADKR